MKFAEECEVEILCELGEPRDRPCPFEIYDIRTHAYLVLDFIRTRITLGFDICQVSLSILMLTISCSWRGFCLLMQRCGDGQQPIINH